MRRYAVAVQLCYAVAAVPFGPPPGFEFGSITLLIKCKARKAVVGTTVPMLLIDRAGAGSASRG